MGTQEYSKFSAIHTELSRWGFVTEKDYVPLSGYMYKYFDFTQLKWISASKTHDFFGYLCLSQGTTMAHNLARQTGGPLDTSIEHFGDKTLVGPDGVVHGGNNQWRMPFPSQMPHAYYSQSTLYSSSSLTEAEQVAVFNNADFMKNGDDGCIDDTDALPEPFTSIKDFYPFLSKHMKWHILKRLSSTEPMFPTQGCRYEKIREALYDVAFHEKLGFPPDIAKARAVVFSAHLTHLNIVMNLMNIIMLLTGTNWLFKLLVGIMVFYLMWRGFLKALNYIGFDIIIVGRWLDDRQFYSKNNAQETMKKLWPALRVGTTDHHNYAWDLPQTLMRPDGGDYVYHCDILDLSAKQMGNDNTLRVSKVPTAQSYLDMGHARGSREDMQSVVLLAFILAFYWYMLFNTGNFKNHTSYD